MNFINTNQVVDGSDYHTEADYFIESLRRGASFCPELPNIHRDAPAPWMYHTLDYSFDWTADPDLSVSCRKWPTKNEDIIS